MPRSRIYVDTSVLGGCFDAEFEEWSNALVADFRAGRHEALFSGPAGQPNLSEAPPRVRALHEDLRMLATPLPLTAEAVTLADRYGQRTILPPKFRNDMLHIAIATVAGADVVASWNFRHIVCGSTRFRHLNAVNVEAGYRLIAIHSPRELAQDDSDSEATT